MLGKYYTAPPLAGLGAWGDIAGDLVGAYADIEKAKLEAEAEKARQKAAYAQRATQRAPMISPSTKLGLMIGLPAVGLLIFALVMKGKK